MIPVQAFILSERLRKYLKKRVEVKLHFLILTFGRSLRAKVVMFDMICEARKRVLLVLPAMVALMR